MSSLSLDHLGYFHYLYYHISRSYSVKLCTVLKSVAHVFTITLLQCDWIKFNQWIKTTNDRAMHRRSLPVWGLLFITIFSIKNHCHFKSFEWQWSSKKWWLWSGKSIGFGLSIHGNIAIVCHVTIANWIATWVSHFE